MFENNKMPKAYASLGLSANFRCYPEDFMVNEVLGFEPTGQGEHWLLHVEKTAQNTHWLAEQLAKFCGVDTLAVGYCGRKDRHAITRQWFSLYDPKQTDVQWDQLTIEGVTLLSVHRHAKKLRLGVHETNQFIIRLRDVRIQGENLTPKNQALLGHDIKERLIAGVPNYFGQQRFGRDGSNLLAAHEWFNNGLKPRRSQKSIVMSAARSYLFNQVLARRVEEGSWNTPIPGDVLLSGIPTGPLWGRGRLISDGLCQLLEEDALAGFQLWCNGLEHCGLKQERRNLVLLPCDIDLQWIGSDLQLSFTLAVGAFATAVLAEVVKVNSA